MGRQRALIAEDCAPSTQGGAGRNLRRELLSQSAAQQLGSTQSQPLIRFWSEFTLAKSLVDNGRYADAIVHAERAVRLDPASSSAIDLRDQVLNRLRAGEPQLVALELAANLNPSSGQSHLQLGIAYRARNRNEDAERAFIKARDLGCRLEAHTELAVLRFDQGRFLDAEDHARAVLGLTSDPTGICSSIAYETLARIARLKGDHHLSADYLRKAFADANMFKVAPMETPFPLVVLVSQHAGNVPLTHILPVEQFGRVLWYMEYAGLEQIDALPHDALIFNAIGEPDSSKAALDTSLEICSHLSARVLNRPERVLATRRDQLSKTLGQIPDLQVPQTIRCPGSSLTRTFLSERFQDDADHLDILVRPSGSHVGAGLKRYTSLQGFTDHAADEAEAYYVSRFWDGRDQEGFFRSYRVICIDRKVYPYHLAIGSNWMVHRHSTDMSQRPDHVIEELQFLRDPADAIGPRAWKALETAAAQLDLDFVGIDFGLTPSGEVVVFEANATMLVRPEPEDGVFAEKAEYISRIINAFQDHLRRRSQTGGSNAQEPICL